MLLVHCARRAASRAACTAGRRRAIKPAMIAMTTSNSISEKPRRNRYSDRRQPMMVLLCRSGTRRGENERLRTHSPAAPDPTKQVVRRSWPSGSLFGERVHLGVSRGTRATTGLLFLGDRL